MKNIENKKKRKNAPSQLYTVHVPTLNDADQGSTSIIVCPCCNSDNFPNRVRRIFTVSGNTRNEIELSYM